MRRRNTIGSHAVVGFPSTSTSPADGASKRLTSFRVVVLPQPDSPNKTSVSPRSTVRFRSEIICVPGREKLTFRNLTSELSSVSFISLLDQVSTTCGSGWVDDQHSPPATAGG